jgi:hypothetical protein
LLDLDLLLGCPEPFFFFGFLHLKCLLVMIELSYLLLKCLLLAHELSLLMVKGRSHASKLLLLLHHLFMLRGFFL